MTVIGMQVVLNGHMLCTAAVDEPGVLTAVVSCVMRKEEPGERELSLDVGGLDIRAHLRWPGSASLAVGDEITIRILETDQSDPPSREDRIDKAERDARERAHYERLKAKYEGSPSG